MATVRHYDLVIIGTGSGNSIVRPGFADSARRHRGEGHVRRYLPQRGLHPHQDVRAHRRHRLLRHARRRATAWTTELHGVRWAEIRDRIFDRIDPIAAGGKLYRIEHPDNANVTVYREQARFVGPKTLRIGEGPDAETITAERFVLAAGGRPVVPAIAGLDEVEYHTSDTIMRIDELPRRMIVLGSGFISAEFAHVFSAFGVEVTVVARSARLLRAEDEDDRERFTDLATKRWDVRTEPQDRARGRHRRRHRPAPGRPRRRGIRDGGRAAGRGRPDPQLRPARPRQAPASTSTRPDASSSTTSSGRRSRASGRSATSARPTSSSTWPTTRRGSCSTTCCNPDSPIKRRPPLRAARGVLRPPDRLRRPDRGRRRANAACGT